MMEQLLSTGSERLHPTKGQRVWDADTGWGHSEKTAAQGGHLYQTAHTWDTVTGQSWD